MAGMRELANHIIAVANDASLSVTNLQIQKVMFFSLGFHMRHNGIDELATETYDIPFEKWKYGPVVESLYYTYNHFKDKDIAEELYGFYNPEYAMWDENIERLLQIDPFELVRVSHDFPSWSDYEEDILQRNYVESYALGEIAEDFRA
ncbi:type II toxin-antitoxin system antitoxin SocA domain-containing protein [Sporosarcina sp. FSL K6-1522]|uniref:Panacea domain-containing protein n=1 Tax=Sporosarcina sp. FSL K6-1522 TaxID=2921554 RepID=UPI003159ACE2